MDQALFFAAMGRPVRQGFEAFDYDINFVTNTVKGGSQPYGNNSDDGRLFRDSGVTQTAYVPDATGLLVNTTASGMRRTTKGTPGYPNIGQLGIWNRDLTNAAWTATTMTAAKTQAGADGVANKATLLTATGAGAKITQATTAASANRMLEVLIKRVTGTGAVLLSLDDTTYTDVTAQVGTSGYGVCTVTQDALTNPTFGIKLATSGDQVTVDFVTCHGQLNSSYVPGLHYIEITSTNPGSIFGETPWAINTDKGPLSSIIKGAYGFYWQGYNFHPTVGGMFVSDGLTSCQLAANNSVSFAANVTLVSGNNTWNANGLLNKIAGCLDAAGNMALAVNGNAYSRTGGSLSPSATHFVLGSNGAHTAALHGWTERFAITANIWFSAAELIKMTT